MCLWWQVLEFVDSHGDDVLSLGSFALLPEHVVRLILSREELQADELTKFQAAAHWSRRYCEAEEGGEQLREVMANFLECIEFYKIPAGVLMREVRLYGTSHTIPPIPPIHGVDIQMTLHHCIAFITTHLECNTLHTIHYPYIRT